MSKRTRRLVELARNLNRSPSPNKSLDLTPPEDDCDGSFSRGYIELTPTKYLTVDPEKELGTCVQEILPFNEMKNCDGDLQNLLVTASLESHGQTPLITDDSLEKLVLEIMQDKETEVLNNSEHNENKDFDSDDSNLDLLTIRNNMRPLTTPKYPGSPKNQEDHPLKTEIEVGTTLNRSSKRKRDQPNWKRNVKKEKINAGKSYVSAKGNLVQEKKLRETCNDKCRHKCYETFTPEEREDCFKSFWDIPDNDTKRQFISLSVTTVEPKYRYSQENSRRSKNQAYYLPKGGQNVRVCKKFFTSTLDIGDTMIRTTFKKRQPNDIIQPKTRGKHGSQPKLDPSLRQSVRDHIDPISRVESHYLRNQTSIDYFEGDMNISTLYRLYLQKCNEDGQPFVKKCIYEQIFNTEYNIGFHKPKKDQCGTCERYKNSNNEEKIEMVDLEYEHHVKEKELSRTEKAKDIIDAFKNKDKQIVAVYDLQAVLPTPSGDVSSFYYKSKISTYNLTIYNTADKNGHCYVWSENIAKRGANEIASCVLSFLKNVCTEKESVIFYSDNCVGQNKNKFVAGMYMYAIQHFSIDKISHKFLITGHTQNEGDSMHSCIEREKRRLLKGSPIYIPQQWIPVIAFAKKMAYRIGF